MSTAPPAPHDGAAPAPPEIETPAPLDLHQLARWLAAARLVLGATLVAAPGPVTRRWLGPGAGSREAKVLARAAGGRDIVLALGAMRALTEGRDAAGWIRGGAAADATDAAAALVGLGRRRPGPALFTVMLAGAAAVAGAAAAREVAGNP